jgi:hypothetical protein
MKHMLLIAGAAALGFAVPAAAKPGIGHGNPHAYGIDGAVGYGVHGCPPGLAKKNPPCIPPGQAKKMFGVGQRFVPSGFSPYAFNRIPYDLRSRYRLNPYDRYYYGNGYLYGVDPRTMVVRQVIGALLGRR